MLLFIEGQIYCKYIFVPIVYAPISHDGSEVAYFGMIAIILTELLHHCAGNPNRVPLSFKGPKRDATDHE